ncbi:hypothetical protein J4216_02520 [Candidatus Woesearchaeota archaeon]|nr:hypothetical protein [Candidatus Woesearchaeota archaeon]
MNRYGIKGLTDVYTAAYIAIPIVREMIIMGRIDELNYDSTVSEIVEIGDGLRNQRPDLTIDQVGSVLRKRYLGEDFE